MNLALATEPLWEGLSGTKKHAGVQDNDTLAVI